jgi:NCAIR mutase (PurE)-related protein
MNRDRLRSLLNDVADHSCDIDQALDALRDLPYEDATVALIDHHRSLRTGVPEVVYGGGKTPEQVALIVDRMVGTTGRAIVSRATPQALEAVRANYPEAHDYPVARMIAVGKFPTPAPDPFVAVVSAGLRICRWRKRPR